MAEVIAACVAFTRCQILENLGWQALYRWYHVISMTRDIALHSCKAAGKSSKHGEHGPDPKLFRQQGMKLILRAVHP